MVESSRLKLTELTGSPELVTMVMLVLAGSSRSRALVRGRSEIQSFSCEVVGARSLKTAMRSACRLAGTVCFPCERGAEMRPAQLRGEASGIWW